MKTRNSALFALGLAAAITLGGAVTAGAQAKKRTTRRRTPAQRIPIRKEVPTTKTDTVIVTRVDTVTVRGRTDTVTSTVVRYDTVTRLVYPPLAPLPGFFVGLGAGANIPMNDIRGWFKDSYAFQGQAGWFPSAASAFGLRADATVGKIGKRDTDCRVPACASPTVWTVGGDAILRFPIDRTSKLNPVLYAFAGGGWSHFGDIAKPQQLVQCGTRCGGGPLDISGGHAYWDVGPGVDFNVGGLHFYAEGRYMTIMTDKMNSHMFPVYGGLKFY